MALLWEPNTIMSKLIYFKPIITDEPSPAYNIYIECIDNHLIDNPYVFTDRVDTNKNFNIPVFHTYYLRHHFFDMIALIDIDDIYHIKIIKNLKYIVIYNKKFHKLDHISDTNLVCGIDVNDNNFISILKEYI